MKNKIVSILREEISKLSPEMFEYVKELMDIETDGFKWYDNLYLMSNSIYFINTERQEILFELQRNGRLMWNYELYRTFNDFLNINEYQVQNFVKDWVEKQLNRKVTNTSLFLNFNPTLMNILLDRIERQESS